MMRSQELALSELRGLVLKAARGTGLAWGLAEEAAWAADWLARRGWPAADWVAEGLAPACEGRPDPVTLGVALADRYAGADLPLTPQDLPPDLPAPGLLLPFLHRIAESQGAVEFRAGDGLAVRIAADGRVVLGPAWALRAQGWRLGPAGAAAGGTTARGAVIAPSPVVPVAASVLECLEGLALRTTVPPSAASRRDAGSGRSDND